MLPKSIVDNVGIESGYRIVTTFRFQQISCENSINVVAKTKLSFSLFTVNTPAFFFASKHNEVRSVVIERARVCDAYDDDAAEPRPDEPDEGDDEYE